MRKVICLNILVTSLDKGAECTLHDGWLWYQIVIFSTPRTNHAQTICIKDFFKISIGSPSSSNLNLNRRYVFIEDHLNIDREPTIIEDPSQSAIRPYWRSLSTGDQFSSKILWIQTRKLVLIKTFWISIGGQSSPKPSESQAEVAHDT